MIKLRASAAPARSLGSSDEENAVKIGGMLESFWILQYAINALDLIHGFSVLLFAILNMLSLLSLTLFFDK